MTPDAQPPSVLFVDPHPDNREMYAEFFRHSGFVTMTADNAADALAHAPEVDVIVTGILLNGGTDGVELVQRLRRDERTKQIPVIVLTACVWKPERERAEAARCDVFLPKPCLPDHLLAEVRQLLALSRILRKRRATASAKIGRLRQRSAELIERSRAIERRRRK